jgi:hypothetical protein
LQQEQQELAVTAALSQLLVQQGAALQVRCSLTAIGNLAVGCIKLQQEAAVMAALSQLLVQWGNVCVAGVHGVACSPCGKVEINDAAVKSSCKHWWQVAAQLKQGVQHTSAGCQLWTFVLILEGIDQLHRQTRRCLMLAAVIHSTAGAVGCSGSARHCSSTRQACSMAGRSAASIPTQQQQQQQQQSSVHARVTASAADAGGTAAIATAAFSR